MGCLGLKPAPRQFAPLLIPHLGGPEGTWVRTAGGDSGYFELLFSAQPGWPGSEGPGFVAGATFNRPLAWGVRDALDSAAWHETCRTHRLVTVAGGDRGQLRRVGRPIALRDLFEDGPLLADAGQRLKTRTQQAFADVLALGDEWETVRTSASSLGTSASRESDVEAS